MDKKRVYTFGNGQAEGKADMKNLLGGKGANLAEMNHSAVPQNGNNCIDSPYQFLLSLVFYTAIIPSFCDETVFNPLTILETSFIYSTVTDFARFLGLSTSHPLPTEM